MQSKFLNFLLIPLFVLGLVFSPSFVVYADTSSEITDLNKEINARKKQVQQLENAINQYNKNILQKQTEAVSLKNQLGLLDDHNAQIETDVKLTEAKIDEAKLEIEALELSIGDKETVIERQKNIIGKMVADIHAEDQKNYLEIMLTNNNLAAFFSQLQYLENVYSDLGQSVKNLRLDKQDLSNKEDQVQSTKQIYENLKAQLVQQQQDLNEQIQAKSNLLTQTHSSELRYETLLASLKKQEQGIESEQRDYEEKLRQKLSEQDASYSQTGSISLSWPLISSHYITATFHDPTYVFKNVMAHSGIDIRSPQGTPVHAAASGYVAQAKHCTTASCYSYVLIVHTGNISTVYGHLSGILVSDDQFVNRGDVIGYSGGTPGAVGSGPFVTGAHLHFETRLNGIPVDPMGYLSN